MRGTPPETRSIANACLLLPPSHYSTCRDELQPSGEPRFGAFPCHHSTTAALHFISAHLGAPPPGPAFFSALPRARNRDTRGTRAAVPCHPSGPRAQAPGIDPGHGPRVLPAPRRRSQKGAGRAAAASVHRSANTGNR